MPNTSNSLSTQLEHLNIYQQNSIKIANAFLEAITSAKENVTVVLTNTDGTTSTVSIPSNSYLLAELQRVRQSLLNISGLTTDKYNAIVSIDDESSFRQVFVNNYKRAFDRLAYSEITLPTTARFDTNALLDRLMSPLTTVELQLPIRFLTAQTVRVTKYMLKNLTAISNFSNGETYAATINKLAAMQSGSYTKVDELIQLENRINRYYGNFNILAITDNDDNTYTCTLDSITYNDTKNVVENSRELQINDKLVLSNGNVRYNVMSVDARTNTVKIAAEAGFDTLVIGSVLQYLYVDASEVRTIRIPLKYNERSIVFLSIADDYTQVESAYSESILLNSSDYTIIENNISYTFDEFFQTNVANIGGYLESIIRENNIPAYLGIKPARPAISSNNFQVVQINKHLTDTAEAEKLKKLNKEKAAISSQIQVSNSKIQALNLQISKGNFKSSTEKASIESEFANEVANKSKLSALYASIVTDIQTALSGDVSDATPKYRIRGFWDIQSPIPSPSTPDQHIIQYAIRYRYVSNNTDAVNSQTISYINNAGESVTGVFSPWTEYKTEPLVKVVDENGLYSWQPNVIEDINQQNINQLDIAINFGESVQIQIKAISEAGYPVAPVMSAWSDIIRIEFPEELIAATDVKTIAEKNSTDSINVAIQNEFSAQGITKHISTSVTEQEKYFAHDAKQISSGFLTAEQKIISLYDKILAQETTIAALTELINRRVSKLTVQMLDVAGNVYAVNNYSTIKLFAGYYTDTIDMSNAVNFGGIVESVFYIKLINNNANAIEILSLSAGSTQTVVNSTEYNTVPISILGDSDTPAQQLNGQILYVRNTDLSANTDYFVQSSEVSTNSVVSSDIDTTAAAANKTVLHKNGSSYETIALKSTASLKNYAVVSTSHPVYSDFLANNLTSVDAEFARIRNNNSILRSSIVQNAYAASRSTEFIQDDKYLIGANTVGSRLFMRPNTMPNIQVAGVDSSSSKLINSGESNAILIPIVFQFRMSDANGFINGDAALTATTNFTYTKSIGIDLLLGTDKFRFDVNVSAKFRPTSISSNSSSMSVLSSIDSNSSTGTQIS